eukprot:NODE_3247_length_796_cov_72.480589_g1753_i24.p2 GENE.NODE_3247_length_796_cov_72.480589_g1753_i24~~NODE_3247_length_796_cov_72.480589_g1753_i24.p2  ORF type:complete len:95 (-),score=4.77 NODE_3247_length_796_cov_72.480589_g1753_i24:132-416(-)
MWCLIDLPVWTRDFTTMYTCLQQERLIEGVRKALEEGVAFDNKNRKIRADKFEVSYSRTGKVTAKLSNKSSLGLDETFEPLESSVKGLSKNGAK